MKNNLLKIKGAKEISKTDQKFVTGGNIPNQICPASGCYNVYIGGKTGLCVVNLGPFSLCCGTIQNGQCCL